MDELFNNEIASEKLTSAFEDQELDSLILQESNREQQIEEVDNLVTLTDYDKKEIKKSNEFLVQDLVNNIKAEIDPESLDTTPLDLTRPEEGAPKEKSKEEKIILPDVAPYLGLRAMSLLEGRDNPILKAFGKNAKLQADLLGGAIEGLTNFIQAFPKKYEALMKDTIAESQSVIEHNQRAKEELEETFYSSGDFKVSVGDKKPVQVDVPKLIGNFVGFAAPMVGIGVGAGAAAGAAGLGLSGKVGAFAASEAALGAVITEKDSGTLINFLENLGVVEREFATKIPFYVDKDDSEIMVSLKGAGEALSLFAAPVAGLSAIKNRQAILHGSEAALKSGKTLMKTVGTDTVNLMKKSGDVIRDAFSIKHIKNKPSIIEDFIRQSTLKKVDKTTPLKPFDNKAFKNYVVRDKIVGEIEKSSSPGYLFDEPGSILNHNKKSKSLKAADQAVVDMSDSINEGSNSSLNDFKKSVIDNDIDGAKSSLSELKKNPKIKAGTKKELNDYVEFMEGYGKMVRSLQKESPQAFKGIQNITSKSSSIDVSKADLEDRNFLSLMSKKDSDVGDLIRTVKEKGLAKEEIARVSKVFPNSDPKKVTDAEVNKIANDLVNTHGHDYDKVKDLNKKELVSLVEFTAYNQYLVKASIEDAAKSGKAITDFVPSGKSVLDKRKLQLLQIKHEADQRGLQNVFAGFRQLRHDLGASFRLLQPRVREKTLATVSDLRAKNLLSEETQMFLTDRILNVDEARLNNVAKKLREAADKLEAGEADSLEAAFKIASTAETTEDYANNFSKFMYNNFLGNLSTSVTNFSGLTFTTSIDKFTDSIIKNIRPGSYHGTKGVGKKFGKDSAEELVSVLRNIEAENATNVGLMASSRIFANFRNKDGALIPSKDVLKKTFISGRSGVDPGSEKYGVGSTRITTEEDRAILNNVDSIHPENDDAIKGFMRKEFSDEVNSLAKDPSFLGSQSKNKWVTGFNHTLDLHSLPLRTLNATDEAFKYGIIQRKLHRIIGEKISKKVATFSDDDMIKFRKNYKKNIEKLYKKELKDLDNLEAAKIEARDPTWTTKYREGIDEPFKFGPLPISEWTGQFERTLGLRVLHPFTRIGLNIADYMSQHTPVLGLLNNKIRKDLMAGGYKRDKAILKQTTGLAFGRFCLYLIDKGIINGDYSSDPKIRQTQIEMGFKPKSLNLSDKVSIPLNRLDPIGTFCTTTADLRNTILYHGNNEDEEKVEEGLRFLSDTTKVLMETASPSQLKDMMKTVTFLLGNEEVRSGAGYRKVGQVINNLSTRLIPKFLFLNLSWFKETKKYELAEYNKDGLDLSKTLTNYLYDNLRYLGTEPEPELDYFGNPVHRYGVPKDLSGDYVDQDYADIWFSPIASEGALKQKKLKQHPVWKELRRLNKFIREDFKSGYYSGDADDASKKVKYPQDLSSDEGELLKGFRLLPRLSRTLSGDFGHKIKLDNKQYNELKKEFGQNGKFIEYIQKEVMDSDGYKKGSDLDKALIIRAELHDAIHNPNDGAIAVFKEKNKKYNEQLDEIYKSIGK